ncbi:hypothetical protein cyc_03547 [Cyclospora cayetanensis]|uniref:Uncharacterized protein n=1 Tax=Cyclospora cayetanensis TaxID=88456 RepID=A0A1D3CW11_9EIME|nr:hypothetical protein cyc_03547 [Cyclospora cayetanensis]
MDFWGQLLIRRAQGALLGDIPLRLSLSMALQSPEDRGPPVGAPECSAENLSSAELVERIMQLQEELSDLSYQVEAARLSNSTLKQENECLQKKILRIKNQLAAVPLDSQQLPQHQQGKQEVAAVLSEEGEPSATTTKRTESPHKAEETDETRASSSDLTA